MAAPEPVEGGPSFRDRSGRLALFGLIAVLFGLGLWPGPLVRILEQAAEQILRVPPAASASEPSPSVPSAPDSAHHP